MSPCSLWSHLRRPPRSRSLPAKPERRSLADGADIGPIVPQLEGHPLVEAWVGSRMLCRLRSDTGEALCTSFAVLEGAFVSVGEACGLRADGAVHCWGADAIVLGAPTEPIARHRH